VFCAAFSVLIVCVCIFLAKVNWKKGADKKAPCKMMVKSAPGHSSPVYRAQAGRFSMSDSGM